MTSIEIKFEGNCTIINVKTATLLKTGAISWFRHNVESITIVLIDCNGQGCSHNSLASGVVDHLVSVKTEHLLPPLK